ncbi:hypothetical protein GJ496_010702 [Pomphorhynchus laevis]|nr:hypothetical protein GJ496_010702 [Pomphorhynchus laevis]
MVTAKFPEPLSLRQLMIYSNQLKWEDVRLDQEFDPAIIFGMRQYRCLVRIQHTGSITMIGTNLPNIGRCLQEICTHLLEFIKCSM